MIHQQQATTEADAFVIPSKKEVAGPQPVEATSVDSTASVAELSRTYLRKKRRMRRSAAISITLSTVVLSFVTVLSFQLQTLLGVANAAGVLPPFFVPSGVSAYLAFAAMGLPLPFLMVAFYFWGQSSKAAQALANADDIRAVGPLIDTLSVEEGWMGQNVSALIRLLPRLESTDAGLLNARQRTKLCQVLKFDIESNLYKDWKSRFKPADLNHSAHKQALEFRIAILQAFARTGDRRALAIVTRLANGEASTPARQRLRTAAQECLPLLQQRISEQEASHTLLRASGTSDGLLRAAAFRPQEETEQLLRASDSTPVLPK